ncbi:MAG: ion channel [Pseudomonadota bacterium]
MLFLNLAIGLPLVILTVVIHFLGLVGLSTLLSRKWQDNADRLETMLWQGFSVVLVVNGLFALHLIQISLYALVYLGLGEFETVEAAFYFSISTFTTVGFGDIVLEPQWRVLAGIESAIGFLLIGWSTAFLVSVTSRIGSLRVTAE